MLLKRTGGPPPRTAQTAAKPAYSQPSRTAGFATGSIRRPADSRGPTGEHATEILDTARDLVTAYTVGYSDGRAAAEADHAAMWAALRDRIHRTAATPTLAERARLDRGYAAGEPCPQRCGRCSACIRADAVRRHRGDYTGGPVTWEAHA